MNLKLPPALQAFVDGRYETGRYASKSEIVYEGLRSLMDEEDRHAQKLAALRQAIQDGLESGAPIDGDDVFTELRARAKHHRNAG
ncbi:MAG: type II toxin-antitoxin system ParD family antitoxin [Rhodospirillaceae bacterium]|nr:type II toxin-antitoxin system ParD family antitoxin [Rhodospirillaceae bacterium]